MPNVLVHSRSKQRATTLVELMVAFGILSLVMTAVISFYVEAVAVSAKRNQQSERLRRFHLTLDQIEQAVREGRIVDFTSYRITLLHLSDLAEQDGFPDYSPHQLQFVSAEDGLHRLYGDEDRVILPYQPGERIFFNLLQEKPLDTLQGTVLSVELHYTGAQDGRSDLLFRRSINLDEY